MSVETYQYPSSPTATENVVLFGPPTAFGSPSLEPLYPDECHEPEPEQPPSYLDILFPVPRNPPSPTTAAASGGPVVARQPRQDEKTRQKRALDRLSDVFNSLGTKGQLLQSSAHGWSLRPRFFEESRAPTTSDDDQFGAFPGDSWLDTATNDYYICARNTTGAAVWIKLN